MWFQNRRAKWRRQEKSEQTSLRVNPDFPMANLKNNNSGNGHGNQSISSSSTSPSLSGGSCATSINNSNNNNNQHNSIGTGSAVPSMPLVDPWLQASQFHQFSNFINHQAAYSQFFPNFQNVAASQSQSNMTNNSAAFLNNNNNNSSSNLVTSSSAAAASNLCSK